MKEAREEKPKHRRSRALLIGALAVVACTPPVPPPVAEEAPVGPSQVSDHAIPGIDGRSGGRLVVALAAEPKTLNPVTATALNSRAIIHRLTADLIRIDRASQETVPELAESWTVSADGRRYTLKLRPGLRFSDGHPADADDVVFSFRVYLDSAIASPGRDLLKVGDQPPSVRKLDSHAVEIELPAPYAAAERLFDGFAILPRHLLEEAFGARRIARANCSRRAASAGTLRAAWWTVTACGWNSPC